MLSREGKRANVDPITLFSGPTARARKHASEDLLRWWADNGRMTYAEFRAQILGRESDVESAKKTRMQSNAKDFI
jgi:hypothetical protein